MQSIPKSLFIFVFCIPLAVVLGIMLATPLDRTTLLIVFGTFVLLLTPILLTSHHTLLILSWNAYINAFFLPGQPYIWMPVTLLSCFFLMLTRTLNRGRMKFLSVPSVTWPLIFLFLVTYATSTFTGGVGAQAIGSDIYGGKRYLFLWLAILGYFAISNIPIPEKKRNLLAALFFLSSATAALSNLAFMLGERFYFLFLLFPVEWAITQAASEASLSSFTRLGGLAPASGAVLSYILLRYGIRGTLNIRHPGRMFLFFAVFAAALMSGFRASFLYVLIVVFFQVILEGLYRPKHLAIYVGSLALIAAILIPFGNKLPISAQRCLTLIPSLDLDHGAIDAARGSTEWRVEMWRVVIGDIPEYLWRGKGYAIDPKDLYFAQQNISLRTYAPYETALVAGDYHNGPLTLIIPFGVWGVLAFLWFCVACIRLLWRNYKYGEASLLSVNTFLLTAFLSKLTFFLFIFGAFYMDLALFTGIVGLSVSLNRGMASPATARALAPAAVPVEPEPEPATPEIPAWQPAFARRIQSW